MHVALTTGLLPNLVQRSAPQFNVFDVMHHGGHEKQLSNVFAWLLDPSGTHQLGTLFKRSFLMNSLIDGVLSKSWGITRSVFGRR